MRCADQAGLVGVIADELDLELETFGLQQHLGASERELAHAAFTKAAAHDDALGATPTRILEKALDDAGERLRKFLDRAVDDAGRLGIALGEQLVERLLVDDLRGVAERVGAELAQRLAPLLEHLAKGAAARLVADEAVRVLDLEIVAVDLDARQPLGAMGVEYGALDRVLGHEPYRRDFPGGAGRLRPNHGARCAVERSITPGTCEMFRKRAGNPASAGTFMRHQPQAGRSMAIGKAKRTSFSEFARAASHLAGRPIAFAAAVGVVLVWAITGPLFGFSDTWQLVINTGTTIITFLMVFVIQNSQNRDSEAIQVKLDELIRCIEGAQNRLLDLEELEEDEIEKVRSEYRRLASDARKSPARGSSTGGALRKKEATS